MAGIALLDGTIKHYDWGGDQLIPGLLNIPAASGKRYAEYWMGVHPQADCRIHINGTSELLRDVLAKDSAGLLGDYVNNRFGTLPYLFKALDVRDMLSIQVHPSKEAAVIDFEAENVKGVPLDSPARNYKDSNHKPELMLALGDFWLLHGFRPADSMRSILLSIPELASLAAIFDKQGYAGLYKHVMELPQEQVNAQLQPLLDRIIPAYAEGKLEKEDPSFWAARAHGTFSQPGKTDRGIFSVYLFNLVKVPSGRAVFQDAGVPHAYLEGWNMEIMASSDNVLRGGLTTKHIDVIELLKHVRCEATHPNIIEGEPKGYERIYPTPAPDFQLSSFTMDKGHTTPVIPNTADIVLLTKGKVLLKKGAEELILEKGRPAAILFPDAAITLTAIEDAVLFKASVPLDK